MKTFTQKFEGFFNLVTKNPEMSFNELQKLAVKKGVSYKRQQMQEEFRLIKNIPKKTEKAYPAPRKPRDLKQVKKIHSRYEEEKRKETYEKLTKQKKISMFFNKTEHDTQVKRFRTPIKVVPNPQQYEQAEPVALEVAKQAYNYFMKKCKLREKTHDDGYVLAQIQLSGYVEIFSNEDTQNEATRTYAGSVQSLSRVYKIGKFTPEFFVKSWFECFEMMLQSLDGYFKIESFHGTLSFWGRTGEAI